MDDQLASQQIIQNDFILRFMCLNRKWTNAQIVIIVSLLSGFLFVVVGGVASWSYAGSGRKILSWDNIGFILAWLILFVPLIWGAYLWQARSASNVVTDIVKNGILGDINTENYKKGAERAKLILTRMNHSGMHILAILILVVFWANEFLVAWPEQFRISAQYWYEVTWYLPIHIFVWSISLYALFLFVPRQIVFVWGLSKIFSKTNIVIRPLHPDEVGGLGVVQQFVKSSVFIAIGIGFLSVLFAIFVSLTGSNILSRTDVLALWVLYVVLAPFCLLFPFFSTQGAMLRARDKALEPVAKEFEKILNLAYTKNGEVSTDLKDIDERLEQIKKHRELLLQVYPTTPLPLGVFRNFSITASIPFVSGIASVAIQLLTK